MEELKQNVERYLINPKGVRKKKWRNTKHTEVKIKQMTMESQTQSYKNIKQKWPQTSNLKSQIITFG